MPRRGENIYKRKDNRWEGRCKIGVDACGRAVYKSVYAATYMDCKNKLKSFAASASAPKQSAVFNGVSMTCGEAGRRWLEHVRPTVKPSTYSVYEYTVEHYLSGLEKRYMNTLTKVGCERFIASLLEKAPRGGKHGLSAGTVQRILIVLKFIFAYAEEELGQPNPVKDIRPPRRQAAPITVFSQEEWKRLQARVADDKEPTAILVAIGMYTGMRIGELCALKKSDIDFQDRIVQVRRTVQRIKNSNNADGSGRKTRLVLDAPKSVNSSRKIPIPDVLLAKLAALCADKKRDVFLLSTDEQKPLDPRTLQYRFKAFLKKLAMRDMNFHALRHTFATRCVEKNVDIKTLSEILGHSNVKLTLEKYVHSSMEFKRSQMNRLEEGIL